MAGMPSKNPGASAQDVVAYAPLNARFREQQRNGGDRVGGLPMAS